MNSTGPSFLPREVREQLVLLLVDVGAELDRLTGQVDTLLKECELFVLKESLRQESQSHMLHSEISRDPWKAHAFQMLIDFVIQRDDLARQFITEVCPISELQKDEVEAWKIILGTMLQWAICSAKFVEKMGNEQMAHSFTDFMDCHQVSRTVHLGLSNLRLDSDPLEIEGLGTLHNPRLRFDGIDATPILRIAGLEPLLTFSIRTQIFGHAERYPLLSVIENKLTVFRLMSNSLVNYNRFEVEHIRPWEQPIHDSQFVGFSLTAKKPGLRATRISAHQAQEIVEFLPKFQRMNWDQMSPWRLATSRLHSGITKLESGSPDALLDFVIGLESIFLEEDSRQDSTHKVAVRGARFLAESTTARIDLSTRLKKIYGIRSHLAHGRQWQLDDRSRKYAEDAVSILAACLRKMVEQGNLSLDPRQLDLGVRHFAATRPTLGPSVPAHHIRMLAAAAHDDIENPFAIGSSRRTQRD